MKNKRSETPRRCAANVDGRQCRELCHGNMVTCTEHARLGVHVRAAYETFVEQQNDRDDAAIAEAEAVAEWRARAGIEVRKREIVAELRDDRAAAIAEKIERAKEVRR